MGYRRKTKLKRRRWIRRVGTAWGAGKGVPSAFNVGEKYANMSAWRY